MNQERWQELKTQIRGNFEVLDEYSEDLEPGVAEVLEFEGPPGKLKIAYMTRPRVLDKKTSYSNRVGSGVKVDYVLSDTETVSHMEIHIWSKERNDWQKFDGESLF